MAMALPVSAAISAWLSLVGMPKYQAKTAHRTIEKSAAQNANKTLLTTRFCSLMRRAQDK